MFMDNYDGDIAFFIRKNYNHPSVIMYSIGNEVSEPATKKGVDLSVKIRDLIIQKDPTRPVTAGYNYASGRYPNADETLKVEVEGGELLGFGSAEPRSEESFVSGIHTTFYGQALAAVRAGEAGLMRVTVTSESGMKEGAEIYVNEE